ncbi:MULTISPECIES: hypothetical protein [Acidiplasma]|nr:MULTISPECIES: hypothetical protein [Acidiplasma]
MSNEKINDIITQNINSAKTRIVSFEKYMIGRSWGLFFVYFSAVIFLYAFFESLISYIIMPAYAGPINFLVDTASLIMALLYWFHIFGETQRLLDLKYNRNDGIKKSFWKNITVIFIFIYIFSNVLFSYIPVKYGNIIELIIQCIIFVIIDFIMIRSIKYTLSEIPAMVYAVFISFILIAVIPLIINFTGISMVFNVYLFYYTSYAIIVLIWLSAGIGMLYSAPDYLGVVNGQ